MRVRHAAEDRVANTGDLHRSLGSRLGKIGREVAVVAHRDLLRGRVGPNVTGAGAGRRLLAFIVVTTPAAAGVAVRPQLLYIVGGDGGGRPTVAVGADVGVDVEIVEQHELSRQLVKIRRDALAEQNQQRSAAVL